MGFGIVLKISQIQKTLKSKKIEVEIIEKFYYFKNFLGENINIFNSYHTWMRLGFYHLDEG